MMKMVAKNERLLGKLDKCEKQLKRKECMEPGVSRASMSTSGSKQIVRIRKERRKRERKIGRRDKAEK